MPPKVGERLADDLGMVDNEVGEKDFQRSESHSDTMVAVGIDSGDGSKMRGEEDHLIIVDMETAAHLGQFGSDGGDAVALFKAEVGDAAQTGGEAQGSASHGDSGHKVGAVDKIIDKTFRNRSYARESQRI